MRARKGPKISPVMIRARSIYAHRFAIRNSFVGNVVGLLLIDVSVLIQRTSFIYDSPDA